MSLLSLTDVKSHLKLSQPTDDQIVQDKLDAAEAWVSRQTGGTGALVSTAVSERVDGGAQALALTKFPVVSVESVTALDGTVLDLSTLTVDKDAGLILSQSLPFTADWYTVAYHSGYADATELPDDLVEAVRLMTKHFYATMRGPSARPSTGGDSGGAGPDAYARAQQIIDDIRGPGFA